MATKKQREQYITQAPSLQESLRIAEYPKLEALYMIARNIALDRERLGLSHHVLRRKYDCSMNEYMQAKWIINHGILLNDLYDEFLESPHTTIKKFMTHKINRHQLMKPTNPKLEDIFKAWEIISRDAKRLYDAEETKREAYLILEQIRTRLNNFMPINCELSDFDWFINQDCCCCGKEPVAPYGNHIIKILTGIPVTICPRCKEIWDTTHDEDMLDKDMVLKALWRYTKGVEQTLNIING